MGRRDKWLKGIRGVREIGEIRGMKKKNR